MKNIFQNGPRSKGKNDQNQVVNEQDQQEKINPEDGFESSGENETSANSFSKNNKSGSLERQAEMEDGNTYEDDPKTGENKMPVN